MIQGNKKDEMMNLLMIHPNTIIDFSNVICFPVWLEHDHFWLFEECSRIHYTPAWQLIVSAILLRKKKFGQVWHIASSRKERHHGFYV